MHGNAIHALMETSDCRVVVKNSPSWHQRQQQRKKTENRHGKWGKGGNHHYQQQQVGEEDLDEKQVCFVEGTRANIDRCLENIRER